MLKRQHTFHFQHKFSTNYVMFVKRKKLMKKITLINFKSLLLATYMLLAVLTSNAQIQKGADIPGENVEDLSGLDVSMPDANTLAIGAPKNEHKNGNKDGGHVRVYKWNGKWIQKGADIDGEIFDWDYGNRVSMPDSNTLSITGIKSHVRVYYWNGTAWLKKGSSIDSSVWSICMPDANTLAVGKLGYKGAGSGSNSGYAQVYKWNGSVWSPKGAIINGEATNDAFGYSLSMPDAGTIAIGANQNFSTVKGKGYVKIYKWNGSKWVQKGSIINGEAAGDASGWSVSMPDSNNVAIGAPYNDGKGPTSGLGSNCGHVRVYNWNGTAWVQKGIDIDGKNGQETACTVSMPDVNTLAIGASGNNGAQNNQTWVGAVRVFNWNGTEWLEKFATIYGKIKYEFSGTGVSMPDSNILCIGAPSNTGTANLNNPGHVRVYYTKLRELPTATIGIQNGNNPVCAGTSGTYTITPNNTYGDSWSVTLTEGANLRTITGTGDTVVNFTTLAKLSSNTTISLAEISTTGLPSYGPTKISGNVNFTITPKPSVTLNSVTTPVFAGASTFAQFEITTSNLASGIGYAVTYNVGDTLGLTYSATGSGTFEVSTSTPALVKAGKTAVTLTSIATTGLNPNCGTTPSGQTDYITVSTSLDVLENSVGNTLEIYPNPAKNVINVKTADTKLLGMAYSIYDNTGKVVLSGKITSENTSIELGNLAAGIYMISIADNMKQTFKVIKR